MTRSRAKQRKLPITVSVPSTQLLLNQLPEDPDQFTIVPANLKIMKVLVEELQAASGARRELSATEIEKFDEENSGDEGDWEDDPDVLDLGLGTTKQGISIAYI